MQDVVVTGMGLTAGHVTEPGRLFDFLAGGGSLVRNHPRFQELGFPSPVCAYIDTQTWQEVEGAAPRNLQLMGSTSRLAGFVAGKAWTASGLERERATPDVRGGVFVACNKHMLDEQQVIDLARHCDPVTSRVDFERYLAASERDPQRFYNRLQDTPSLVLAERFGLDAMICTQADACAAGGMVLGSAFRHIRHGELDLALVGGVEVMCDYTSLLFFSLLGALAQESRLSAANICRPFDQDRCGFVIAEGSAFLVLESAPHARARGASALARIAGYAGVAEACRITASEQDGSEYARCMELALRDADLSRQQVDHINAHGTSTQSNDACEAAAIRRVFGEHALNIPVTSNKSALGHSLANSGVVEAVLSVLSLQRQQLLPTLNHQKASADCAGLQIVTTARPAAIRNVLSNSFGFGGENCTLVIEAA